MDKMLKKHIEGLIKSHKVFVFMKGTPDRPACGFSMRVVQILRNLKIDFQSFDVYTDENIRQGIKEYANWPTIPQIYIDGKSIGGCDITEQLAESGKLQKLAFL